MITLLQLSFNYKRLLFTIQMEIITLHRGKNLFSGLKTEKPPVSAGYSHLELDS